jgi:predicted nucleic acid-binding protein
LSIVTDMSVVLAWFFEEEHTKRALGVLDRIEQEGMLVPPLWWSELENGILMGERRRRKTGADSAAFLKLVRALPIQTDDVPRHRISDEILEIGRGHQLTAYDAAYVELAQRQSDGLATFDVTIRRCARALGLKVFPAAH